MTAEAESGEESSEEVGVDVGGCSGVSKKCDEKGGQKVGSWAAVGVCHDASQSQSILGDEWRHI